MCKNDKKLPQPATPNLGEIVQAWLDGRRVQAKHRSTGYNDGWFEIDSRTPNHYCIPNFDICLEYRIAPEPHHHKALIEKWIEAPDEYVLEWRQHLAWHAAPYAGFDPKCDYRLHTKATGALVIESPARVSA